MLQVDEECSCAPLWFTTYGNRLAYTADACSHGDLLAMAIPALHPDACPHPVRQGAPKARAGGPEEYFCSALLRTVHADSLSAGAGLARARICSVLLHTDTSMRRGSDVGSPIGRNQSPRYARALSQHTPGDGQSRSDGADYPIGSRRANPTSRKVGAGGVTVDPDAPGIGSRGVPPRKAGRRVIHFTRSDA